MNEGCKRIMGIRAKDANQPCRAKVWVNPEGEKAVFCPKCMRLRTFQSRAESIVEEYGGMYRATAGKYGEDPTLNIKG